MDVDRITGSLLLRAIRDLAVVRRPPKEIMGLALLAAEDTIAGKIRTLELLLYNITWDELGRLRQALEHPHTSPKTYTDVIDAVKADLGHDYRELSEWTALYHRYFAPICLSSEQIAPMIGVSPRNYRRWIRQGAGRLAVHVQRLELAARE